MSNRIDAFLDDQSAAAASADEHSSIDGRKARPTAAAVVPADEDEYPSYSAHISDTYPSSFTPRSAVAHLRIETVVVQSKMRLVHVSWYVLLVGLTWAASLALWVGALCFTSTARASLFSSTYPLILLCWMRWKGVQVSWMEMAGVVVALVGIVTSEVVGYFTATERIVDEPDSVAVLASGGADGGSSCQAVYGSSARWQLLGDVMMIVASFLNAFNIVYASRARRVLRLFTYTLSTTTIVTVSLVLLSWLAEQSPADLSSHGLFGWLADLDMLLMISAFGFVVGCIGVLGQNYAVRYTSPRRLLHGTAAGPRPDCLHELAGRSGEAAQHQYGPGRAVGGHGHSARHAGRVRQAEGAGECALVPRRQRTVRRAAALSPAATARQPVNRGMWIIQAASLFQTVVQLDEVGIACPIGSFLVASRAKWPRIFALAPVSLHSCLYIRLPLSLRYAALSAPPSSLMHAAAHSNAGTIDLYTASIIATCDCLYIISHTCTANTRHTTYSPRIQSKALWMDGQHALDGLLSRAAVDVVPLRDAGSLQLHLRLSLDLLYPVHLLGRVERHCHTLRARSTRSTAAMDVRLARLWRLQLYDQPHTR